MYDVLVAGAGPAGAATAAMLASQGFKVVLFDKEEFPRYKACAGGVDGVASAMLQRLGIDIGPLVEEMPDRLRVSYRGKNPSSYQFRKPLALMTMRSDLDALLAGNAAARGAAFHDGEAVKEIVDNGTSIEISTPKGRYEGKCLVGADGVYSKVARHFHLNPNAIRYVLTELEVQPDSKVMRQWKGVSQIDISIWPLGYGWVFPKRSILSVGAGVPFIRAKGLKPMVAGFLHNLGLDEFPVLTKRSHQISFRRSGAPVSASRVLLVGDAAGLVDPNTGGGIGWALRSAESAATAVASYLEGSRDGLLRYSEVIENTLGRESQLARIMRNTIVMHFMLFGARATGHRPLWEQVVRVISGEESYDRWYNRSKAVKFLGWSNRVPI